ncbi:MAG TPA: hypothetical protein VII50_03290 [Acidothermaceae bacterium]
MSEATTVGALLSGTGLADTLRGDATAGVEGSVAAGWMART